MCENEKKKKRETIYSWFLSRPKISPRDDKPSTTETSTNEINRLQEENYLLKDIIDRAAASIVELIQVNGRKKNNRVVEKWRLTHHGRVVELLDMCLPSDWIEMSPKCSG